jgi:uncharacterized protein (DUF433 family)
MKRGQIKKALKTEHPYVERVPGVCGGVPIIKGTRIAVRLIAALVKSGLTPEDILRDYPHLSLAQIYDAVSFYFDHKEEIEGEVEENKIENIMQRYDLRLIPYPNAFAGRLVTKKEFEELSEEEKESAYTWETLPDEWKG